MNSSFGHGSLLQSFLLAGTGVVTAIPLLLFATAARRITMTSLGLLQYIAPTLQFLLGVFVFHEVVSPQRWIGFGVVWVALAIYSLEGITTSRRTRRTRPATP